MSQQTLFYVHDPMCSWCWGFRSAWLTIKAGLEKFTPDVNIQYVLGGLAADSDEPMPLATQQYVKANWQRIQQVIPDTEFNYDFWSRCRPRRSTYPACRAVIAATQQGASNETLMILAIQKAYYLEARNPSDEEVLCECAASIGLDVQRFTDFLRSKEAHQRLQHNIDQYHLLTEQSGASGFPSLILSVASDYMVVPIDYNQPQVSLDFICSHLSIPKV